MIGKIKKLYSKLNFDEEFDSKENKRSSLGCYFEFENTTLSFFMSFLSQNDNRIHFQSAVADKIGRRIFTSYSIQNTLSSELVHPKAKEFLIFNIALLKEEVNG